MCGGIPPRPDVFVASCTVLYLKPERPGSDSLSNATCKAVQVGVPHDQESWVKQHRLSVVLTVPGSYFDRYTSQPDLTSLSSS